MDQGRYETVPQPQRLWKRALGIVAASYAIDGVLLGAFAIAGVLPASDPILYVLTGFAACGFFYGLIDSGYSARFDDSNLTLAQLGVAVLIQLCWIIAFPVAALYHVTVLFVIFGFASLRLRPLEAFGAWAAVAILVTLIFTVYPQAATIPHGTPFVRTLVGAAICVALGKCTMLGLYSSRLRVIVGRQFEATKESLKLAENRSVELAASLHEGLGQELTGISLLLTALGARLRRDGHPGADDVAQATEHVCEAIKTSRTLADSIRRGRTPPARPVRLAASGTGAETHPPPCAHSPASRPRQRDRRRRSHT